MPRAFGATRSTGRITKPEEKCMRKILFTLTSVSLLALAGCSTYNSQAPAPAAAAKPSISPQAQAALDAATASMKEAKSDFDVWTVAEAAYKKAQAAAAKGDSATVIKEANEATALNKLSIQQSKEPPLEQKNL